MSSTFFRQRISKDSPFFIGRSKDTDFELQDASVSRRHAKIEKKDGRWVFTNLSGTSGTLFNGKNITEKVIEDGDVFLLGLQQLRFSLKDGELSLSHVRSLEDVPAIPLSQGHPVLLGRGADDEKPGTILHPACPRVLLKASLSGKRLKLYFVRKITNKIIYLENNETVKLPWCLLEFRNGNLFIHQKDVGFSLVANNVSVTMSGKEILDDIRFSLASGKILAIIGQSGQGKSTLLDLLAGKVKRSRGSVLIDGIDYEKADIRREIAYLPQEPLPREALTVQETLLFAARISLPGDYSRSETEERAGELLDLFGISSLSKSKVAVLSGGERKRVALASQLMGAPGLILLDEPLSGLDPLNAKRLCAHLKALAAKGHTIVLSTHSYEALRIADNVLVIHQGKEGFYGSPDDALRYFNAPDPEGILEALSDRTAENWKESGLASVAEPEERGRAVFPGIRRKGVFFSFFPLIAKQWSRDRGKALSLLVQPVIIGFLLSQIFTETSSLWVAAFALVLCANWFALSLSTREIVQEKELLLDEFRRGMRPVAALGAKLAFTSFFALIETGIVFAFFARNIGVHPSSALIASLLATVVPASSAGLLLSALSKNSGQANAFLPLVILPQIALSGALVPLDKMTPVARFLSKAIWTSYDQSAIQDVFTGVVPAVGNWAISLLIAFLIYIITLFALETMKNAK